MESSTKILRRMLDERDVEHSDFASAYRLSTRWQDSGKRVIEHQLRKDADIGDMGIVRNLTPEQAIAATLGSGTCKVESMHGYTDARTHTSWCVELSCHTLDAWEDSIPPSYCPICGRKVVDDG